MKNFSKKPNNSSGSNDWIFHNSEDICSGKSKSRSLLLSFWKKNVEKIIFFRKNVLLHNYPTHKQNVNLTKKWKTFIKSFYIYFFKHPWKTIIKLTKIIPRTFSGLIECKFDKHVESFLSKVPCPLAQTPKYEKFFWNFFQTFFEPSSILFEGNFENHGGRF